MASSSIPIAGSDKGSSSSAFYGLTLLAFTLLYFPNALRYILGTSSNAVGLIIACGLICLVAVLKDYFSEKSLARLMIGLSLALITLIAVHLFIAINWNIISQSFDFWRTALSFAAIVFSVVTGGVIADWLLQVSHKDLQRLAVLIATSLIIISAWAYVGFQPPSAEFLVKPTFPFTEPSHLALIAAPFIIQQAVRLPLTLRYLWLGLWLTLAFANQSLSLIVVISLAAAASLPVFWAVLALVPVAMVVSGIDLQYYSERLDLSIQSDNLSALIYRQGWELARAGLDYNSGLGIGFQQLGLAPLNVPTSDMIFRILRSDANLRDGSFMLAKLVGEFGIFGIALVAAYSILAVKALLMLRRMAALPAQQQNAAQCFALSICCGFAVEMFVRGIGYFSASVILLIAVLAAWRRLFAEPAVARGQR